MRRRIVKTVGLVTALVLILAVVGGIYFFKKDQVQATSEEISIIQEPAEGITLLTDIQYQETEGNRCYFDIAYQDDGQAKPLLVFVHGGSWMSGSKEEMNSFLYTFSTLGYTAVSVDYDLLNLTEALQGTCVSVTDEEACVSAALGYLAQHAEEYQIDTDRVVLIGHSAGGQLIGHLAEQIADRPEDYAFQLRGIVLLAAPSDLRYYLYNNIQMEGLNFSFVDLSFIFDGVYGTDVIPEINKVDILYNITENLSPVLILHGSDDTLVPLSMSQNLYNALIAEGVTAELTVIPGEGHSLLGNETVFSEINHFLNRYIMDSEKE